MLALVVAGGLALVYLVVGVKGATPDPDSMSKFWPAVFAVVAGLLIGEGCYLPREWRLNTLIQALYVAVLAAAGVRFLLLMKPPPGGELPDPAALGLPTAGPASAQAAHSRLSRSAGNRPKFPD